MDWACFLAYFTGTVDHELLLLNEYLVPENRILKAPIKTRLELSDAERARLAEIRHRLAAHNRSQIIGDSKIIHFMYSRVTGN